MSYKGFTKQGVSIVAAFMTLAAAGAIAHVAANGESNAGSGSQGIASPVKSEALAQPSLPVVTISEPQAASAARSGESADNEFSAQQLLSGNERGLTSPGHVVVRSQAQLEALLQRIYSGQVAPDAPRVDFTQYTLVYYSLGTGMHGDDRIYIRRGSLEQGVLHVQVEIAHSGGNCLKTTSLTAPFAIAALPFPAHEVLRAEYDVSHKSYPCE